MSRHPARDRVNRKANVLAHRLGRDLVIAPYASALALMVEPEHALENLSAAIVVVTVGYILAYLVFDRLRDRYGYVGGAEYVVIGFLLGVLVDSLRPGAGALTIGRQSQSEQRRAP